MQEERVLKKYPNRRLYDTTLSRYVTQEDVRRLVLERIGFRVIDARSGADLTRTVLLQIVTEREMQGPPLLMPEALTELIRLGDRGGHEQVAEELGRCLADIADHASAAH
ncbi:MAG TPA: polyhydroxyalkanoate synthesis regulator DNA-binding domain-containing protein [Gemmatimonadales bacterium]|jgi:polyhydroxyalkanoate synthesis repressor PhaR|nr:polyhydroxyalkanoate synthesis regulator DNA-binding domain-containing protein [Gemmatimonadales bacterium]